MFKKILVPTDGSELSAKAIAGAIDYARLAGAKLVGLCVVEPYPYVPLGDAPMVLSNNLIEYIEQLAQSNAAKFNEAARAAGVDHEAVVVDNPNPWSAIIDVARDHQCDAIFMASHGRKGLNALLLGSETHKVLIHSDLPVMVYR